MINEKSQNYYIIQYIKYQNIKITNNTCTANFSIFIFIFINVVYLFPHHNIFIVDTLSSPSYFHHCHVFFCKLYHFQTIISSLIYYISQTYSIICHHIFIFVSMFHHHCYICFSKFVLCLLKKYYLLLWATSFTNHYIFFIHLIFSNSQIHQSIFVCLFMVGHW